MKMMTDNLLKLSTTVKMEHIFMMASFIKTIQLMMLMIIRIIE